MGLRPTPLPASSPLDRISNPLATMKRKLIAPPTAAASAAVTANFLTEEDEDCVPPATKKPCIAEAPSESSPVPDSKRLEVNEEEDEGADLSEDNKENQRTDVKSILTKPMQKEEGSEDDSPKVIVEVQPLPSIYELRQNAAADAVEEEEGEEEEEEPDQFDSGLSLSDDESSEEEDDEDDVESGEEAEEDEDEDEDEEEGEPPVVPSPLYNSVFSRVEDGKNGNEVVTPPPPKTIYNDRFWSQSGVFPPSASTPPPQASPTAQTTPAAGTPPPPSSQNGGAFHFLDQTNQRIEENGKSYLQLGTMNHPQQQQQQPHAGHHLPVTPIIQPKPGMVYPRRPIPPFNRGLMGSATGAAMMPQQSTRPVCDHSNCLQKKSSHCYKTQRTRMLNLSLHKLHMARQNHEGCLRRSVLICNMLRHIEEETERESHETQQQFESSSQMEPMEQYWSPPSHLLPPSPGTGNGGGTNAAGQSGEIAGTLTPSQYHLANGTPPPPSSTPSLPPPSSSEEVNATTTAAGGSASSYSADVPFDAGLKDFNSAFRATPFSSPAHQMDVDSGIGDEDKGINWGSVLSLSNQSELDPLNNNSFANEPWTTPTPTQTTPSPPTTSTTSSAEPSLTSSALSPNSTSPMLSTSISPPPSTEDLSPTPATTASPTPDSESSTPTEPSSPPPSVEAETSAPPSSAVAPQGFDDIGWKLSADDVLRAFPSDEQIFVGP